MPKPKLKVTEQLSRQNFRFHCFIFNTLAEDVGIQWTFRFKKGMHMHYLSEMGNYVTCFLSTCTSICWLNTTEPPESNAWTYEHSWCTHFDLAIGDRIRPFSSPAVHSGGFSAR